MKHGEVIKSAGKSLAQEELELINKYTRIPLSEEELYTFSVVLCDNDIDRDYERFSVEALFALEKLFEGKTGVFDHVAKAENQTARIYSCKVESVSGKKTATGDEYFRLVAKAYLPRSKKNEDIIIAIDAGMQKEVSIGCSVAKSSCSVCGSDMRLSPCTHTKGKKYKNALCYAVLSEPTDAYEWSFVAVPAQRLAGVIKNYNKEALKVPVTDILKKLYSDEEICLSKSETTLLLEELESLKEKALMGEAYKDDLKSEVVRLSMIVQPEISRKTIGSVVEKFSIDELKSFKSAYEQKSASLIPLSPQLAKNKNTYAIQKTNSEFKI